MAKKKAKPKKKPPPKAPPEDRKLTEKQDAWCQWMVSAEVNFNGVEAARRAGYKGNDAMLSRISYENRRKPNTAKQLARLKAEALSGAGITIEKVLRDVEVTRAKALEAANYSAAMRGSELEGKYLKMWTDRIEHVTPIDEVTDEQLDELIEELIAKRNVDIRQPAAGNGSENGALSVAPGKESTH